MRFVAYFGNSIACQCLISASLSRSAGTLNERARARASSTLRNQSDYVHSKHNTHTHTVCVSANMPMPHFSLIFKNGTHIFCLVFPLICFSFLHEFDTTQTWMVSILTLSFLLSFFVVNYCYLYLFYSITILALGVFLSLSQAWSHHIHHSNISPFYQMADGKCETSQMKSETSRQKDGSACEWTSNRKRQTSKLVHC